jgi:hypothetical protein
MATRIFLAVACSGIGFLVYVLTEFVRESRRGKGNHHAALVQKCAECDVWCS